MFGFKKKENTPAQPTSTRLNIFNKGTDLEFAECENCGDEMERWEYPLFDTCPRCGARFAEIYTVAEE